MKGIVRSFFTAIVLLLFLGSVQAANEKNIHNIFRFEEIKIFNSEGRSPSPSNNRFKDDIGRVSIDALRY